MSTNLGASVLQYLLSKSCLFQDLTSLSQEIKITHGKVGTMRINDIIGAIQTSAKKGEIIKNTYREEHALYSSISDAIIGVCRNNTLLQESSRTTYLSFVVARGRYLENEPGDWIIVAIYGYIGSTTKGHEHEVVGFGIKPI